MLYLIEVFIYLLKFCIIYSCKRAKFLRFNICCLFFIRLSKNNRLTRILTVLSETRRYRICNIRSVQPCAQIHLIPLCDLSLFECLNKRLQLRRTERPEQRVTHADHQSPRQPCLKKQFFFLIYPIILFTCLPSQK